MDSTGRVSENIVRPLADRLQALHACIEERLDERPLAALTAPLAQRGVRPADAAGVLNDVRAAGHHQRIASLKTALSLPSDDVSLERWLLLQTMRVSVGDVSALRVPDVVKQQLCEELAFIATPDERSLRHFRYQHPRFAAMAKMTLLRRYPAGLFQWEESGIPRSWLLRVPWRDLPRLARVLALETGGFGPMLVPHLNARRRSPWLTETAANRSYYLMAQAIEAAPRIRGIVGASWFRAPGIVEVAPHLAWVNRVFLENGGLITTAGRATESSGVFANNPKRRALYDEGRFQPMIGLAVWPRAAVLAWMRAHPELAPATP